ncbi:MAG: ribosomal-processing cysteine protease Prp [Tindallia sp. MSAO_Bac2]|nr:MAG: ribosomal-processing cysteine protease Prp [Tindallia sp. MSAO_Bac2]
MVNIRLFRNKLGDIEKYVINGHANTAAYGEDIVCAAISVLAQTMILGINRTLESEPEWSAEEGDLVCIVPENITNEQRTQINTLLETMVLGFENIQSQYPEAIRIETKEVR